MKIGVALSGCDIGGVCAVRALEELEAQGLEIGMISACGVPSIASLFYAYQCPPEACRSLEEDFLRDACQVDLDYALANLSVSFPLVRENKRVPVALSAVDLAGGSAVTFTDDFSLQTGTMRTLPLHGTYDALCAAVGGGELGPFALEDHRLCDFATRYGAPLYPLRMLGFGRLLSVTFPPAAPNTAYQVMLGRIIEYSGRLAGYHLAIPLPAGAEPDELGEIAAGQIKNCMPSLLEQILF